MPPVGSLPVNVQTMSTLFALLTVVAQLSLLAIVVLAIGARLSPGLARARDAVWEVIGDNGIWLAWIVALTATLGSLYLSEIAHFVPCKLCWYQRIAMYPLAVVLLIAALRRDRDHWHYAVPVAAIGAMLSTYHYQLERFPHQTSLSCERGSPLHRGVDLALPLRLDPDDGPQRVRTDHRACSSWRDTRGSRPSISPD